MVLELRGGNVVKTTNSSASNTEYLYQSLWQCIGARKAGATSQNHYNLWDHIGDKNSYTTAFKSLSISDGDPVSKSDNVTVASLSKNVWGAIDYLRSKINDVIDNIAKLKQTKAEPAGTIKMYGGATAPSGYLFCRGQSVAKVTYPELFSAIGYTYGGSGDVFNLPDFRGTFARGLDAGAGRDPNRKLGTMQEDGVPNITGNYNGTSLIDGPGDYNSMIREVKTSGALYYPEDKTYARATVQTGADYSQNGIALDASRVSNVYQDNLKEVRPINVAVNFIIKT